MADANQDSDQDKDRQNSTDDQDGGNQSQDDNKDTDFVSKSKFDKVFRANSWAQSKVKELGSELNDLRDKLSEFESRSSNKDDNNDDKKKDGLGGRYENRLTELEDQLKKEREKSKRAVLNSKLSDVIRPHIREGLWDTFVKAHRDDFEIDEQGELVMSATPEIKGEEALELIPDELKRPKGGGGAGVADGRGKQTDSDAIVPRDFSNWDQGKKKEYFHKLKKEDPAAYDKIRREVFKW